MPRPDLSRVPQYFHNYINQVQEDDLMTAFKNNTEKMFSFLKAIPEDKHDYRYADGKWTVKEVLQHMIDTERVFGYRSLCFARRDTNSLPGFNENVFAANARTEKRKWNDLLEEFSALRKSTEIMFASFDNEQLDAGGVSNNNPNYVLGMGFICVGHCNHHMKILRERYL